MRTEVKLDATRFTTPQAVAREVAALLENSEYRVIIVANQKTIEAIAQELEDRKVMGRVKIIRCEF